MTKGSQKFYINFWNQFLKDNKSNPILFNFQPTSRQIQKDYIKSRKIFGENTHYSFVVYVKHHLVELTIQETKEESARLFNLLYFKKLEIEALFGENIDWDGPRADRNRCKIKSFKYPGGYLTNDKYAYIFENFLFKMEALTRALKPHLK